MTDYKLTALDTLLTQPYKPQWLIKDHMEKQTIGMIFGKPASAKSFIAMDIAFCVANGMEWNGNSTEQGDVVYIAGEGFNGIRKRFKALEEKYQANLKNIYISEKAASFMSKENTELVYEGIKAACTDPILIIIDTLHRNFGTGDENSSKDFGEFLENITTLGKALNASILIVHHSGHGASDRGRGSSAIKGALEVEYKVVKDKSLVTIQCTKAKEFPEPEPSSFNLIPMPIPNWFDDDGKPIESAILESTKYVASSNSTALSKNESIVLQALEDVITDQGIDVPSPLLAKYPGLTGKKYIHLEQWRARTYSLLDQINGVRNKPQANQKAFSRARSKLLRANKVANEDQHYWLAA